MSAIVMFILICSHAALFMFGMFVAMTAPARAKNKEYQRLRAKEMRQVMHDEWNHPSS
mgnify:CR=1 FL=1|tara:strand:- start:2367 stop:2540 length:174 start_codon:yes stop_codon:yes gene_type:complete